jgi:hypothetical protein
MDRQPIFKMPTGYRGKSQRSKGAKTRSKVQRYSSNKNRNTKTRSVVERTSCQLGRYTSCISFLTLATKLGICLIRRTIPASFLVTVTARQLWTRAACLGDVRGKSYAGGPRVREEENLACASTKISSIWSQSPIEVARSRNTNNIGNASVT